MRFEPMMRVLQTLALPLGHVALKKTDIAISLFRAGDEARTHDLLLGKETFYQLNYTRKTQSFSLLVPKFPDFTTFKKSCQPLFCFSV